MVAHSTALTYPAKIDKVCSTVLEQNTGYVNNITMNDIVRVGEINDSEKFKFISNFQNKWCLIQLINFIVIMLS